MYQLTSLATIIGLFLGVIQQAGAQTDAQLEYMGSSAPFQTLESAPAGAPVVTLKNGSYYGTYDAFWDVDKFFGIRYESSFYRSTVKTSNNCSSFAAPVIGNNRFRAPQPVNESWTGVRNATTLGPTCPASFPSALWTLEDCLNLQIYRPAGVTKHAKLPVMVYFYGGGGLSGSASDPRFNMTTMVNQGAKIGKPFIAIVPQYRMRRTWNTTATEISTDCLYYNRLRYIGFFRDDLGRRYKYWYSGQQDDSALASRKYRCIWWGPSKGHSDGRILGCHYCQLPNAPQ